MKRVILESPYGGNWWQRWRNVVYARRCMADCLRRGEAPFASHLLYTQPGVLRDDRPAERERGISAAFLWRSVTGVTVVYVDRGVSAGMRRGIAHAKARAHRVEYRSLYAATVRAPEMSQTA